MAKKNLKHERECGCCGEIERDFERVEIVNMSPRMSRSEDPPSRVAEICVGCYDSECEPREDGCLRPRCDECGETVEKKDEICGTCRTEAIEARVEACLKGEQTW